ncbi:hypothetical protein WDU94_009619 [Cyamophila willieti]
MWLTEIMKITTTIIIILLLLPKFTFKITGPKKGDVKKTILLTAKDLEPIEGKSMDANEIDKIQPAVSLKAIPINTQPIKIPNEKLPLDLKRNNNMDVTPADPNLNKINTNVHIKPVELHKSKPRRIESNGEIPTIKTDAKSLDMDIKTGENGGLNLKPQDAPKLRNFNFHIDDIDQSPKSLPIPSQPSSSGIGSDGNKIYIPTKPVQNASQSSNSVDNQKTKFPPVSLIGHNPKDRIPEPVSTERKSRNTDVEKEETDRIDSQKDSDDSKRRLNLHIKPYGNSDKNGKKENVANEGKTLQEEQGDDVEDTKPKKINLKPVDKNQTNKHEQEDVSSETQDTKYNNRINVKPTEKDGKDSDNQDGHNETFRHTSNSGHNEVSNNKPSSAHSETSSNKSSSSHNKTSSKKSSSAHNETSSNKASSAHNESSSNKLHETSDKKGKVDHHLGKTSPSVQPPVTHSAQPLGTTSDGSVAYFISDEDEDEDEYEEEEEETA